MEFDYISNFFFYKKNVSYIVKLINLILIYILYIYVFVFQKNNSVKLNFRFYLYILYFPIHTKKKTILIMSVF